MTSACGLCGKDSIDAVRSRSAYDVADDPITVDPAWLVALPRPHCAPAQAVFDKTGGLHAAALFDAAAGELLVVREDVGRHNAVDKVVGWAVREGRLPLRGTVLMVSGRASFELAQKASMAGIPMLAAVSAPSSLAVELAHEVRAHARRLPARRLDGRLRGRRARAPGDRARGIRGARMSAADSRTGRLSRPRGRASEACGRRCRGGRALARVDRAAARARRARPGCCSPSTRRTASTA